MERLIQPSVRRRGVFAGAIAALFFALLTPRVAHAHVAVLPVTVPMATTQVFTVRVPTERDVPTVSVRVEFPPEMVVLRFGPMPGWTREVEQDGAGRIVAATWSGGMIAADEYQDFVFLGRTPREPGVLTFNTYQTYEGGETVAWVEEPDQDRPAPTVEVVAAEAPLAATETHMDMATGPNAALLSTTASAGASATGTLTSENVAGVATTEAVPPLANTQHTAELVASDAAPTTGGSDLPLIVALVALVVALVAVALAAVAVARRPAVP